MNMPRITWPALLLRWTWLLGLVAALAISAAVWWPVTLPSFDFAPTSDGEYHLLRLFLVDHSLRAGLWYPRWLPDLFMGFGYPLFNFYAPLAYYLGAIFIRIGLDTYGALQAVTIGAVLFGTAGMYALAMALLGTAPRALFAASAYVLAPYPFITSLYLAGSVTQMWGIALLPWVLWASLLAYRRASLAASVPLTIALSALVLLHNLSALLGAGLLLLWVAVLVAMDRHVAGIRAVAAAAAVALGLTAFFWSPALGERGLVQFELAWTSYEEVSKWLYDPWLPVSPVWAFDVPYSQTPVGPVDLHTAYPYIDHAPLKPSLGQAVLWSIGLLGVASLIWHRHLRQAIPIALFLAFATAAWWLTTKWSDGVWEVVALLRTLQFPFRLHSVIALGVAVAAAAALPRPARLALPLGAILVLLSCSYWDGKHLPPGHGLGTTNRRIASWMVLGCAWDRSTAGPERQPPATASFCRAPSGGLLIRPGGVVGIQSTSEPIPSASGSAVLSVHIRARWTCMASTAAPTGWLPMSLP